MPVVSELLESTALRHPGTSPMHVKVLGGLRNASLSFVGPPADRKKAREESTWEALCRKVRECASWKKGHQSFRAEQ